MIGSGKIDLIRKSDRVKRLCENTINEVKAYFSNFEYFDVCGASAHQHSFLIGY